MKATSINLALLKKFFKRGYSPTLHDTNKQTLGAYNTYAQDYIKNTPKTVDKSAQEMKEWIDIALKQIPLGGRVFEIGSATLRDANYMRSRGYSVTCSDATQTFLDIMRQNGENAEYLNILETQLPAGYNMVFANGVFPHFNSTETRQALKNIRLGIEQGAVLAISVKEGSGENWIKEKDIGSRFTHYWQREDIIKLLKEESFDVIFQSKNLGTHESHRWMNFVAIAK